MPFASFNPTNPRTNPLNFHKKYQELAILKNDLFSVGHFEFFFKKKLVKVYWLVRMGRNIDDYPGFQPKITPPKHFSRQCTTQGGSKLKMLLQKGFQFIVLCVPSRSSNQITLNCICQVIQR